MLIHRIAVPFLLTIVLWSQIPNADGVSVTGEVKSDGIVMLSQYTVELRAQQGESTMGRAIVSSDGRFQFFGVAPGLYTFRVLDDRQEVIAEELRRVDASGVPLELTLAAERAKPSGGTISLKELSHPIPKKARKDFEESQKFFGDPLKAIPKLEEAVRLAPQFRNAHANLGALYGQIKKFPEAVAEINKALEIGPPDAVTYVNLAMALNSLRQYTQAEQAGRKALALEPKNAKAEFLLGYSLAMQAGKERDALEYLKLASPDFREALLVSAQLRKRAGDNSGARRDMEAYKLSLK